MKAVVQVGIQNIAKQLLKLYFYLNFIVTYPYTAFTGQNKFLKSFSKRIIITSVAFCFTASTISNVVPFSAELTLGNINNINQW